VCHSLSFSNFCSGLVADTPQTINLNTLKLSEEMQEKEKKHIPVLPLLSKSDDEEH
jgi:hypothetical protein